jgi:hypothetical protein
MVNCVRNQAQNFLRFLVFAKKAVLKTGINRALFVNVLKMLLH